MASKDWAVAFVIATFIVAFFSFITLSSIAEYKATAQKHVAYSQAVAEALKQGKSMGEIEKLLSLLEKQ